MDPNHKLGMKNYKKLKRLHEYYMSHKYNHVVDH